MTGLWIAVAVLAAATVFGLLRRRRDGVLRARRGSGDAVADTLGPDELGAELGEKATLLQFSSAFCAPCRATRRVLGEVAEMVDGVVHVELDAESHLDLVRRLNVIRTPTVLVLDGAGRVVRRAAGAPRKPEVLAALGEAIP
ncbi:thioredoxin family protein [Actinomadura decatromicini]|uniref:Thioredoxin family protein n=1 Tax=Actinomadura decatromicini TaxID=2604572 RepID=A0A5D3F7A6_9ACTN|nr:thioredoxin family protein [Actinomadura decatromicini]TYK43696.1 thioredoxin family protein [Actinomadura decatromicini]